MSNRVGPEGLDFPRVIEQRGIRWIELAIGFIFGFLLHVTFSWLEKQPFWTETLDQLRAEDVANFLTQIAQFFGQ